MGSTHLQRGAVAGAVGGLAFGLYVFLVSTPLVRLAESYEGSGHGHATTGGEAIAASATSVLGGVLFGLVLGTLAFGLAYYFLEPAIPGGTATRSYLLGAAGFLVVSGSPWVALPPRPPGVESALPTDLRLVVYGGMILVGLLACLLVGHAHSNYAGGEYAKAGTLGILALSSIPAATVLVPTGVVSSPAPPALAAAFRWSVVFGQALLWFVLASVHATLVGWTDAPEPTETAPEGPPLGAD